MSREEYETACAAAGIAPVTDVETRDYEFGEWGVPGEYADGPARQLHQRRARTLSNPGNPFDGEGRAKWLNQAQPSWLDDE